MSDSPQPTAQPIKKLTVKKYFELESEWVNAQGRRRTFGRWFLQTYFPNVTDDDLYNCKETYRASLIILAKYILP